MSAALALVEPETADPAVVVPLAGYKRRKRRAARRVFTGSSHPERKIASEPGFYRYTAFGETYLTDADFTPPTGAAADQNFPPHEGVLLYDEQTGIASFVEFFPASADSLWSNPGQVNVTEGIGTIELGADGLPTVGSLQGVMQTVIFDQGARGAFGVILPNLNAKDALAAANAIKQSPPAYTPLGLGGNSMNCSTFSNSVLGAGGVTATSNLPDGSISNLSEKTRPSQTFMAPYLALIRRATYLLALLPREGSK